MQSVRSDQESYSVGELSEKVYIIGFLPKEKTAASGIGSLPGCGSLHF